MAHNESEHRSKCPKWAHTPTKTDNVQYKIKQSATDYINLVHPQVPLSLLQLLDPPDNLLDSPPHLLPLLDHTQNNACKIESEVTRPTHPTPHKNCMVTIHLVSLRDA